MSTRPAVHCSTAQRARIETELLAAYKVVHKQSAAIILTKLKVSENPNNWGLSFIRRPDLSNRRRQTQIELAACVSPEWLYDTPRMAEFARMHGWLVAGTQPLVAPTGIDSITLIHAWVLNGRRLVLKPVKTMIFCNGSISQISKSTAAGRFSLTRELTICTAAFKATVARRIADLLLRKGQSAPNHSKGLLNRDEILAQSGMDPQEWANLSRLHKHLVMGSNPNKISTFLCS